MWQALHMIFNSFNDVCSAIFADKVLSVFVTVRMEKSRFKSGNSNDCRGCSNKKVDNLDFIETSESQVSSQEEETVKTQKD